MKNVFMIFTPVEGGGEGGPGVHVCGMSNYASDHIWGITTEVILESLVVVDFQLQPV
jgi:hypothetical protein